LLQVAGGNTRDLAIVMLFLQTGLRVSELVNLKLTDIDFQYFGHFLSERG
jgi:integrase